MTTQDAGELFRLGQLDDAIAAAGQSVHHNPIDVGHRMLLAELLLFAGAFERADAVLRAAEAIEPEAALVVAEFRQLLRGAMARQQLTTDGRVPEFLGEPTVAQQASLQALVALRAGDAQAAADAAAAAEAVRPAVSGVMDGVPFNDFRDADDLHGCSLEVLTTTGKYFWVPTDRLISIEFHPPKRPRDLFWRRCTMTVRNGPDGDVYLPALYETASTDDALRLGRGTAWADTAPVRGTGQRMFLVGDEGLAINQLRSLEFA